MDHINENSNKTYIKKIQKEFGVPITGIVNEDTIEGAERFYGKPVISHEGKLVPINFSGVINHGYSLHQLPDLTKYWTYRKQPIDNIVIHAFGLNANNAYQELYAPKYKHLSSNFLIGLNVRTKQIEVFQCLDTCQAAMHGGKINKQSISIDICQNPSVKFSDKTNRFYKDSKIIKNRSNRGDSEIVDVSDELSKYASEFINALREFLDLSDKPTCKDENIYDVKSAKEYSVIGQHNVSMKLNEIAGWAEKIYHNL